MEYHAATDSFGPLPTNLTPASSAPRSPQTEVGKGGMEIVYDGNGGAALHRDSDQPTDFQASTGFGRDGDLLSTAINSSGSPVTGRPLTGTDRIVYGGLEVDLRTAERMGLVTVNHLGRYEATDQGNQGATPVREAVVETALKDGGTVEAAEAAAFRADNATEEVLSTLVSKVSQSTNMAMVTSFARDGEVSPQLISAAAQQAGVSSEDMEALVTAAVEGMGAAVDARLASLGVHDPELFEEWIEASLSHKAEANEALINLMLHNSTTGFEQLAITFAQQLDTIAPDDVAEALEEAGLRYTRQGGKTIITFNDGAQVSYEVAVKQGLIKVSRN